MKEYKCPKCNSKNLFVKKVGNNTGLYCGDCGAWIKWVGKNELRAFEYLTKQKHVDDANSKQDDIASIIYSTLDHMYCDNCRFNSISIHVPAWGTTANFHKYSLLFYAINIIFLLFIIPSLFSLVLFILLF